MLQIKIMNNLRNGTLTVLFTVSSLITITRSVSGMAAFNFLKQLFCVKISIQIYKNTTFGVFCCTQHGHIIICVAHACYGTAAMVRGWEGSSRAGVYKRQRGKGEAWTAIIWASLIIANHGFVHQRRDTLYTWIFNDNSCTLQTCIFNNKYCTLYTL